MLVKIKKLKDNAVIPAYQSQNAAAADLCACLDAPFTIAPGERAKLPTGLAIECEHADVAAIACARSGLSAKYGITLANGVGVIDSDYRGELLVSVVNLSDKPYTVSPGERVAQLMFIPVLQADFLLSADLSETSRGSGGFGSTGSIS